MTPTALSSKGLGSRLGTGGQFLLVKGGMLFHAAFRGCGALINVASKKLQQLVWALKKGMCTLLETLVNLVKVRNNCDSKTQVCVFGKQNV